MLCRMAGFWLALCVSPALLPCDRDAPPLRQDLWQQARCCTPVTIDTEQLADGASAHAASCDMHVPGQAYIVEVQERDAS